MAKTKTGADDQDRDEGGDEKGYLTEADLDAKLNAALTNYQKRFEKKMTDMLGPVMTRFDEIQTKIDAAAKAPEKKPEGDDKKAIPDEVQAQLKRLEDQVAAERKARETAENERKVDAEKARAEKLSATLATALRDLGISNPVYAKAAQKMLESDGRVAYDEDGTVKLKVQDKYGESLVDLADGLAAWSKSEEGSAFMPARDARGSGGSPGRAPGKSGLSAKDQARADARALLESLS